MTFRILPPIKERIEDYEDLEQEISRFLISEIYDPIVEEIGGTHREILENASGITDEEIIIRAIQRGQIRFYRGKFTGKLSAMLSRALRRAGARWDRKQGLFSIPHQKLPDLVRQAIAVSDHRFQKVMDRISEFLSAPFKTDRLNVSPIFSRIVFKVEKDIQKTIKGITIAPQLSKEGQARISDEYAKTIHLPIQDFMNKETRELRERIMKAAGKGARYETLVKEIQRSYGVSQRKAKFLARQETSLLMTKFKQVRYQEAGSHEYIWGCVVGSPGHEVRHFHKKNEGKKFRWDTGATINEKGEKRNPGQDYNCRCFARPIVRF